MSIRNAISHITERFNNAKFADPKQKQEVAERLRHRVTNALQSHGDNGTGGDTGSEGSGQVNFRGLANRVNNSNLSDDEKKRLLTRITNAAHNQNSGGTPPTDGDTDSDTVTAASEVAPADVDVKGAVEQRRLLAKA